MATAYTSLLGLALPVTGELSGTWGDTVNNSITSLLDSAISGTTTISADADITLTTTTGAANEAREAILLWTAGGTVTRNITAPAQSKTYIVINKSSSTQSIVLRGVGPTTGVTIVQGESAVCAWNGTDFIKVSNISGAGSFTNLSYTGTLTGGTGIVNLGSGQFYKDASGNVGIGTSSPTSKLHVRNDADALTVIEQIQNRNAGASAGGVIAFINATNDLADNRYAYIGAVTSGAAQNGNNLVFATNLNGGAPTERMRITSTGGVSFGATGTAYGTTGQVLTSQGNAPPVWASAGGGTTIPAGTAMLFAQTAAPTGFTKSTTHDNKALRVVSGTASSGGTTAFTTVFANQTPTITTSGLSAGATTLTTAQIPSHSHTANDSGGATGILRSTSTSFPTASTATTGSTGGGGSHTHTVSGTATSSAITLNVQYVDVIIATKD